MSIQRLFTCAGARQEASVEASVYTLAPESPLADSDNDDDPLFDEARRDVRLSRSRDNDPQTWAHLQLRRRGLRRRNMREWAARSGGMALAAPFGTYAMLLGGQAAVHAERAASGASQQFRVGALRTVGMGLGAMAGAGPITAALAGSLAGDVNAAAGRAWAFVRARRVLSHWPMREEAAPLFVSDQRDDDDAQLLDEWEVIARVRT